MDDPFEAAKALPYNDPASDPFEAAKELPAGKLIPSENPAVVGLSPEHHLALRLKQERTWEQVAPELKAAGVDPEPYRQNYQLGEARAVQKGEGVGTLETFLGSSIPFGSAIRNWRGERQFGEALKRYEEGKGTAEDAVVIARHERIQQIEHERSAGGAAIAEVAKLPAILGEFGAGGKIVRGALGLKGTGVLARSAQGALATPFVPSTYLVQGAVNQNVNPNESTFQSYGPALALAASSNAVLGSIQNAFSSANVTRAGRIGLKTAGALVEQQAADVGTTAADRLAKHATGYSLGLDTKYGTLGSILSGEEGALKHATTQALTFAVFSGLHSGHEEPRAVIEQRMKDFQESLDEKAKAGLSPEAAGRQAVEELRQEAPAPATPQNGELQPTVPRGTHPLESLTNEELTSALTRFGIKRVPGDRQKLLDAVASQPTAKAWAESLIRSRIAPERPAPEPVQVSPEPAIAQEPQRQRFVPALEISLARLRDNLRADGLSEPHIEAAVARAREEGLHAPDAVTGFEDAQKGTLRTETAERAIEHVARTGEKGVYVEMDLQNLGGINRKLGHTGADEFFKKIAGIIREEMGTAGSDVSLFRHGGDEMSAIVVNGDRAGVTASMRRAHARIAEAAKEHGLADIEHTKVDAAGRKRRGGTGVHFGVSEIQKGDKPHDLFARADKEVEQRKESAAAGEQIAGRRLTVGQSARLARMREKQAAAGPTASPKTAAPVGPTVARKTVYEPDLPKPPEPELDLAGQVEKAIVDARLNPVEAHIVRERLGRRTVEEITNPRALEDIANDPIMLDQEGGKKKKGTPYSKQRIKQIEQDAMAKMGFGKMSIEEVHKQLGRERLLAKVAQNGDAVPNVEELRGDPENVKAVNGELAKEYALQDKIEALQEQYLREREANGGRPLSSERERWFAERGTALAQALAGPQSGQPAPGEELPSVPGPAGTGEAAAAQAAPGQPPAESPRPQMSRLAQQRIAMLDARIKAATNVWIKTELEAERDGTVTFGREVRMKGGIDPMSLSPHERQLLAETFLVNRWQDVPIFKNEKGERGTNALDDMADQMRKWMPERNDIHGTEQLLALIEAHAPLEQGSAHADKMVAEYMDRELEHFKEQTRETIRQLDPQLSESEIEGLVEEAVRRGAPSEEKEPAAGVGSDDFPADDFKPLFDADGAPVAHGLTARESSERVVDEMIVGSDPALAPGMGAMSANFDPNAAPNTFSGQLKAHLGQQAAAHYDAVKQHVVDSVHSVVDNIHELAGHIAPRTARHSEAAADAIAHHIAADTFVERALPVYIDKVLGPITGHEGTDLPGHGTPADKEAVGKWFMATAYEERLRHQREVLLKDFTRYNEAAKHETDVAKRAELGNLAMKARLEAAEVRTIIGRENSQLAGEADYERTVALREYQAFKHRWQTEFVPVAEKFYRKAEGLEPDEVILTRSQLPGFTFTAKAIREGDVVAPENVVTPESRENPELATFTGGTARGRITNVRQGKLGAAKAFKGTGDYDIDPKAVMENMLRDRVKKGTKAEMYRQLVRDGLALGDKEGKRHTLADGRVMAELPIKAPRGTQEGIPGGGSLYVHPDIKPEVSKALGLNEPFKKIPSTGILTKLSLASFVEFMTHARNLSTFVFKPGVSPIDIAKNFWGVVTKNPDVMKKVVDLAEMGAVKPKGLESGNLWGGKYDPTKFMSRALDVLDSTMRLTASDAFDRLAARYPDMKAGEYQKRNFINQLGQYIKVGQNDLVAVFRDTGLGPFATAGTNYTVQGIRTLFGDTGLKTGSLATAAKLRAEFFLRVASPFVVAAIVNQLRHGRPDGDDNTPLGGLKVGTDSAGKTAYLDLGSLTGLPRGARTLGLLALLEGKRSGVGPNLIANRAAKDVIGGFLHPLEGPAVAFAHGVATGENTIGQPIARKAGEGEIQKLLDLQGALANANPVVATITGLNKPRSEVSTTEKVVAASGVGSVAKFRGSPPGGSLVDEVYDRLHALDADRQAARRQGVRFAGEPEYRRVELATHRFADMRKRMAVADEAGKEKLKEEMQRTAKAVLGR